MQNFSVLQLLNLLSSVSDSAAASQQDEGTPAASKTQSADEQPFKPSVREENAPDSPTHAQIETDNRLLSYESFSMRHEQAVRRIKKGKNPQTDKT